jgi:vacuolar-type H+-ATPase subunit H
MTARSPLTEIRSAELAAARVVASATEHAESQIIEARNEAVALVDDARVRGRKTADERHEATLDSARERASEISRSVEQRIATLHSRVIPEIDRLVDAMLGVVLPRLE